MRLALFFGYIKMSITDNERQIEKVARLLVDIWLDYIVHIEF